MKRSETHATKNEAFRFIFDTVRTKKSVIKASDIYSFFGDIWNTSAYFVQDVLRNKPADIHVETSKKGGTFLVYTGPAASTVKEVIMGGLVPAKYVGRYTIKQPGKGMIEVKKFPKMLANLPETEGVFRIDKNNKPSQYLQVTKDGNFLFKRV